MAKVLLNNRLTEACGAVQKERGSAVVDYIVILVFTVLVVMAVISSLEEKSSLIFTATEGVVGNFGKME